MLYIAAGHGLGEFREYWHGLWESLVVRGGAGGMGPVVISVLVCLGRERRIQVGNGSGSPGGFPRSGSGCMSCPLQMQSMLGA